jgi:hypothetical protein
MATRHLRDVAKNRKICFTKHDLGSVSQDICAMENKPVTTSSTTNNSANKPTVVMRNFNETPKSSSPGSKPLIILIVVAILGVGTGFGLAQMSSGSGKSIIPLPKVSSVEKGKTYGATDTSAFKDTAEGTLKEGGIEGEGQYHLVRPGGDSQNVYMTSSTVDLSQFIDKKVKVWGATQTAQHAGWLMDVGKVEVQ